MLFFKKSLFLIFILLIVSNGSAQEIKGKLFIIGGGKRPAAMLERLLKESIRSEKGYIVILPMASEEPDSAIFYGKKQFTQVGFDRVAGLNLSAKNGVTQSQLDSLTNADLIFISGGDQNRFMESIKNSEVAATIQSAYKKGSTIAGTSAGAAVMSQKMITGNSLKVTEYEETFESIESDNLEIKEGLGLLGGVIVDQHFIRRSRYNRLITAVLEYPECLGIGIEEATAILVTKGGKLAEVVGEAQVVVLRNPNKEVSKDRQYLKGKSLRMDILTAGDFLDIK